ncbi:MAG: glycosyltransferase family 2 protein [Desulfobacterales bacterium]|jgi:glycosyltransferase involved in cell wall biosynthesis|nr:glycosyltransferase family 2 protein [Desulfobacterales bacterium]
MELTILMPCLNEAETLGRCVAKARAFLVRAGVDGEVLVADNGSSDGSPGTAEAGGARVVAVAERGYGAALRGGIAAARGRYVVMGDADDSYDFSELDGFLAALRAGADLVMGNRFRGGIRPGAMPILHQRLGNPVLSFAGRLFFKIPVGDFHCGLRGFRTEAIRALELRTAGMEFASEMVVRAALERLKVAEVPTTLSPDGRSRPPHLRTWRDGWRHLRFLLTFSPRWLFLYPGAILSLAGLALVALLFRGPVWVGGVGFETKSFMAGCLCLLVGVQSLTFALMVRRYASRQGYLPRHSRYADFLDRVTLERLALGALALFIAGCGGVAWCFLAWWGAFFGPFDSPPATRLMVLSITLIAAAVQVFLTAFLVAVMEAGDDARPR